MSRRNGYSLVEVVVVIAILAVFMSLLVAAVQKVRAAATASDCRNRVRQLGIGLHDKAATANGRLPSVNLVSESEDEAYWMIVQYSILLHWYGTGPFLTSPCDEGVEVPPCLPRRTELLCPADPSPAQYPRPRPVVSYPANAVAFAGRTSLTANFPDGLSQTIAFAEHYAVGCRAVHARCLPAEFRYDLPLGERTYPDRRPTFADGGRLFGGVNPDDDHPVTAGSPAVTTGSRGRTFQDRPRSLPPAGPGQGYSCTGPNGWSPLTDCDPAVPQTAHPGGMTVGLLDGSVRTVRPGVDERVFWAAVTPAGGEVLADW
jgi:prepilin-type N-terminal cleavage/methylation domain-containing protein